MRSWYRTSRDEELKDGRSRRVYHLVFETDDKQIVEDVEQFFCDTMDRTAKQTDCDHKRIQTEIGCEKTDCPWK